MTVSSHLVTALRREREDMLAFCNSLTHTDWSAPSAAPGWRVQDVVVHLSSGCRAIFSPSIITILSSRNIERTNDVFDDRHRTWTPEEIFSEYTRWSGAVVGVARVVISTPLARFRLPLAELGLYPLDLILCGALTFDHHVHLRHDISPALNRPVPDTDAERMRIVLRWMFAVLNNQLTRSKPANIQRPLRISLHGPAAGDWIIGPSGRVSKVFDTPPDTTIHANTLQFPEWATRRADWRERDVTIVGDSEYGEYLLDQINVV